MRHLPTAICAMAFAMLALGCEDEDKPAACVPVIDYPFLPGTLWGPCLDDGSCTQGACYGLLDQQGSICIRNFCTNEHHPHCAAIEERNAAWDASGTFHSACLVPCETDGDCTEGMACVGNECLWPSD